MKRYNSITAFSLLTILCMLLGCTDIVFEDQNTLLPEGKIRLVMNYDIPQGAIVETKAVGDDRESTLQNAVLLVFEATNEQQQEESDRLIQVVEGDIHQNQTVSFVVSPYKGKCRIKVLANLDEQALAVVRSYQTLESPSATTIQEYKELKIAATSLQGDNAALYLPLCSAEPTVFNGINASTDLMLTLKRIYARIDVAVDAKVSDFTLLEIFVNNVYKEGRFEPYTTSEFPVTSNDDFLKVSKLSSDALSAGPIYMPENIDANENQPAIPTTLIVKGLYSKDGNTTEGYYNLFIEYKDTNNQYQYTVNRNIRYNVIIQNVSHYGYKTYDEANRSSSENSGIEMDVVIDDLTMANDIIYHKQGYAISSTNTDVDVYAASDQTTYVAATINFVKKADHPNPFIPSRSIRVLDPNSGISIINGSEVTEVPIGTPVDIKIELSRPDVSGTIEVRFGGLRKLIKVRSFKMLRSDKQYHIEVPNVINVEKKTESVDSWLKYGSSLEYGAATNQNMTFNTPTTVYCMAPENTGETREASPVYLYRKKEGTLKLIATQTYGSPYINNVYSRETGSKTDPTHKEKRANSLLIPTKQAQTYHLTGSRIYDYYGSNFTVPNPKAEIVWSDFKFKDPNPFEPHDLIEVETPSGSFEDVIFRVRKYHANCGNVGNGNVIWGIKDDKGSWVWSWHAWLTDMVEETNYSHLPNIAYSGYWGVSILADKTEIHKLFEVDNVVSEKCLKTKVGGVLRVYLDRNMGAKTLALISSSITQLEGLKHYGLYYQWGRKDPFPINNSFYTVSNPNSNNSISKSGVKITITESLKNPLLYIISNGVQSDPQDWCSELQKIRWNSTIGSLNKGTKTIFDPSPYGWRVNWGNGDDLFTAQDKEWQNFIGSTNNSGGLLIQSQYWIPALGSRYFSTADVAWGNSIGAYWTARDVSNNVSSSYCSYFFNTNGKLGVNNNYYIYRTYGCQVRPVLDN